MTTPDCAMETDSPKEEMPFRTFLKDVFRIILTPTAFFEDPARDKDWRSALGFLFLCSVSYSLLASFFVSEKKLVFFAVFLLNAILTPFLITVLLRLVTTLLCRAAFTTLDLFRITAYAHVTLLISWIPDVAWMAGIWKFFLFGTGLVCVGRIGWGKAIAVLCGVVLILLLFLQLVPVSYRF